MFPRLARLTSHLTSSARTMASATTVIAVGSNVPSDITLVQAEWSDAKDNYCGVNKNVQSGDIFKGKRVVLFAVPGAFTPTCHLKHAQGFIEKFDDFAKYKIDSVVCTAVNDGFVLGAWAKSLGAQNLVFLADGAGVFARAIGLTMDTKNMGVRSQRYALVTEDGVVKYLGIGGLENSGAEAVLAALEKGL